MSRRLAQTLLMDEVLSAADLETALQRQVVLGGSLDTNLLETELLTEQQVLAALGTAYGLPFAGRPEIDGIGPHLPRLFPLVFAETYHMVPLHLVDDTLHVLTDGAADAQITERIRQRLQLNISPVVTTEARMHYAMQKLYNTELLPRFTALVGKLDGLPEASPEKTETHSPAQGETLLSWGVSAARIAMRAQGKLTGQDVRSMVARLNVATDRDTIVEILLGFALAVFEFAGLFIVQGDVVHGWRSTDPETTRRLAQISLPLNLPSVFQTIYATQGHYLGPLPHNQANVRLLSDMGRAPPHAAFLAPVLVGGKVAAILYGDRGGRGVSPKKVAALLVLVGRAGLGLENLIRARKGSAAQLAEAPPEAEAQPALQQPLLPPMPSMAPEDDFSAVADLPDLPLENSSGGDPAPVMDRPIGTALGKSPINLPVPLPAPTGQPDGFAGLALDMDAIAPAEPDPAPQPTTPPAADPAHTTPAEADAFYVAFADMDESPEGNLDDWEDVMVETVSEAAKQALGSRGKSVRTGAAPFSVRWEDVVVEAHAASRIVPVLSRSVEMMGTVVDESDIWLDGLDADDPEVRRSAIAKLLPLGSSMDAELGRRFPGRLRFDPLAQPGRPPPLTECSGLLELLAARGPDATGVVLPLLDHASPQTRYFAVYFLLSVVDARCVEPLAKRLYDTEPRIRHLAIEALRRFNSEATYRRVVQGLREQLKVEARETQMSAVQILGQLREPTAVPVLIPLVVSQAPEVVRGAASALAVISAQAFGTDLERWQTWWQSNYNKPRAAWLLSGLAHPNATIRRVANTELQHLTGQVLPFDADAPEPERQRQVQAWQGRLQDMSQPKASGSAA